MVRLGYISTLTTDMSDPRYSRVLMDILMAARTKNKSLGVTGVLLVHGNLCVQILEGEANNLSYLMYKISRDTRHKDVEILFRSNVSQAIFPDWGMRLSSGRTASLINSVNEVYKHDDAFRATCDQRSNKRLAAFVRGIPFNRQTAPSPEPAQRQPSAPELSFQGAKLSVTTWPKASQMVLTSNAVKLLSQLSGRGITYDQLLAKRIFPDQNDLNLMLNGFNSMGILTIDRSTAQAVPQPVESRQARAPITSVPPRKKDGFAKALQGFLKSYARSS